MGDSSEGTFVDEWIEELFEEVTVVTRRHIESWLYQRGVPPGEFTKARERLVESKRIVEVADPRERRARLYARRGTRPQAIDKCSRRAEHARQIMARANLGRTGENYARSVILRSGVFGGVTQRHELGRARLPCGSIVDIKATMKCSGKLTAVEVKNRREVSYPYPGKERIFNALILTAVKEKAFPLLVTAYISDDAAKICERIGLAVLGLRRQILPKSVSVSELHVLRQAFGPELYDFIEPKHLWHRDVSKETAEDVRRLRDSTFLADSLEKWIKISRALSKLTEGKIRSLTLEGISRL